MNNALQSYCCLHNFLIFVPLHKSFLRHGKPRSELYSTKDKLHLNGAGVEVLERGVRQALSAKNLLARSHWKRRPIVAYNSHVYRPFWVHPPRV